MTLRIGAFSHILLGRGASKFENHLVSGRKVSHRAKIVPSHFRGALSECPRDKFLIPTLTRQYIGQAWACVICLCACVCVSSCMSILYCPGVLSGSRAAWSTEITVSSEGGGLVVEGGGEDCFSAAGALPEDCREIHYFSPLSTNIGRGLPRPAPLQTRQRRAELRLPEPGLIWSCMVQWVENGANAADIMGIVWTIIYMICMWLCQLWRMQDNLNT